MGSILFQLGPLESLILDAAESKLSTEARARYRSRIRSINKVQRVVDDKEVNLFVMKGGRPFLDNRYRFEADDDEVLLATVLLKHPDRQDTLKAEVLLSQGHVTSLAFNQSPSEFTAGLPPQSFSNSVQVTIWIDPMIPSPRKEPIDDPSRLKAWLQAAKSDIRARSLWKPLPNEMFQSYQRRIDAELPSDYLELVALTEGVEVYTDDTSLCTILGMAAIRRVVQPHPEENLYVLAEHTATGKESWPCQRTG